MFITHENYFCTELAAGVSGLADGLAELAAELSEVAVSCSEFVAGIVAGHAKSIAELVAGFAGGLLEIVAWLDHGLVAYLVVRLGEPLALLPARLDKLYARLEIVAGLVKIASLVAGNVAGFE